MVGVPIWYLLQFKIGTYYKLLCYCENCFYHIYWQSSVLINEVKECNVVINNETQYKVLEDTVTPLCRVPYDNQLKLKQQWTNRVCKELRSRLHKSKSPIMLPKVYPISAAVSIFKKNIVYWNLF